MLPKGPLPRPNFRTQFSRPNNPFHHGFFFALATQALFPLPDTVPTLSYSSVISNEHSHPLSQPVSWVLDQM